jgi:hypothetical protein
LIGEKYVSDDLPEQLPITEAEIELIEAHLIDLVMAIVEGT